MRSDQNFTGKIRFLNLMFNIKIIGKWVKKPSLLKLPQTMKRLKGFGKISGKVTKQAT